VGAAPRILVVAGDAVEAAACELALETGLPGSAVAIERSAVSGLSAARTGAFHVVVAGTDLPDGHELDVVRSLAAEPGSPPVVAMLGAGSERLAAAALAAGAEDALAARAPFTVALADSVAIAYGRALHARRRRELVELGERLDAESQIAGVLDAAVAGLALILDAEGASAWLSSPAGARRGPPRGRRGREPGRPGDAVRRRPGPRRGAGAPAARGRRAGAGVGCLGR
jgi:DNA-binding NarL/FixJ family response regulator